jgi:hypothetical protein
MKSLLKITRNTIIAVAAFALATANARDTRTEFNSLEDFLSVKPGPMTLTTFRPIVAAGGPSIEQERQAIVSYIRALFKDPDSVKAISLGLPFFNHRATIHKDWIVQFRCNAKNSFGAYTGQEQFTICWAHGDIDWDGTRDLAYWTEFNREILRSLSQ